MADRPSPDLPETTVVAAREGSAACELDGEAVVLNLESGLYHGLNEVGTRVWELLAEPRTVGALRDALCAEYEVEPGRALEDVRRLLAELVEAGLVELREGPAPA